MALQSETQPLKKVTTYYWPASSSPCTKTGYVQRAPSTVKRYIFSDSQKLSNKEPRFIPGQFLVKPYYVSSNRLEGKPVSATISACRSDGGFVVDEWNGDTVGFTDVYNVCKKTVPEPTSTLTSARLAALVKVSTGELTLAQEFGELKETLAMLKSPLSELRKFLERKPWKDFDNLRFAYIYFKHHPKDLGKHAQRFLIPASNTWLEWRYGLRPLIYTIKDLLELAEKQRRKATDRILTKRRRILVFDQVSSQTKRFSDSEFKFIVKERLRVEGIAYYKRVSDQTWSEFLGFDIFDVPSTIWELTRMSFVIDWVISIGDWIRALTPHSSVQLLGSSQSWKYENKTEILARFYSTGDGTKSTDYRPAGTFQSDVFKRDVMGIGTPLPTFKGIDDIDLQRAIDSLALIHTGISRKLNQIKRSKNVSR